MNSIVNVMPKYDHRQHILSDWLAELDQRFQLGEVEEDTNKITWCQLLISATGSGIFSSLEEATTWEEAKGALLTRLGIGSVRDKAWAAMKNLKKGAKDIVELAGEAEKLAKRLHPRDEDAAERHAVDAFLGALDKTLAMEVQKLGHRTMEEVVAAAQRIEKILEEQTDSKMERLVNSMQDQIRILRKDLKEANKQIATHKAAAPTAAAMAAIPAPTVTTAVTAQAPPTAPARRIYHDYRHQNPAVRPEEMAQVQQMLSTGVIRPSNSPWASPVVMVKKKDGSLWFCIDFRQLNAATIKDAHPIPHIDDLLDALHGARWFSTLDLKSGYWQVPIQEEDKEKTAFRTSSGQLFEFNQVPFGLCNAPNTFSRLMDRVLAGLHWETCLFYLDDIIIFDATWEEHLARLRQIFERFRHTQLKLRAEKCTFSAKEVSYPGSGRRPSEVTWLPSER